MSMLQPIRARKEFVMPLSRLAARRCVFSAAVVATSLLAGTAIAAPASSCGGKNILDELQASDAQAYKAVRESADAVENGKGVLWKIEHKGSPDHPVSYLFGTIHVTDDRVIAMSPAIIKAMNATRRIALEVEDVSPSRMLEALGSFGGKVLLPEGESLEKLLSPADAKKLGLMLHATGVPADVAMRLQPWLAYLMMSYSDCERSRITGGKLPLDGEIARIGEERGVGVIGLETVETQFLALSEVPAADQLAILKSGLAMRDRVTDLTETMIQLYLKRDLGAMWPLQEIIGKSAGIQKTSLDAFSQSLLVNRNFKMRDRAVAHLAFGGVFVAVGAAHLPGTTGLITLLRDVGYTVTLVE
jgi:uncharacterized protein